jgi:hypothetical protein
MRTGISISAVYNALHPKNYSKYESPVNVSSVHNFIGKISTSILLLTYGR